jgi:hypothetical protein
LKEAPVQRWEYLDVYLFEHGVEWIDSQGRVGEIPTLTHENWVGHRLPTQLSNELGDDGWELVGAIPAQGQRDFILCFKRPKG